VDAALFTWLNGFGGPPLDTVFWTITELGKGEYATLITALLVCLGLRRVPYAGLLSITLAAVLAGVATEQIKHAVDRPRPLQALGEEHVRVVGEPLRQRSFPSGHTASAFALCVSGAALVRTRRSWGVGVTLASLVGVSRIMVGAHFPGDVLGGALLGTACGLAVANTHAIALRHWSKWRLARRQQA
jgi:membrane-associated phospholipid phosphatase